jgi:hypothetical protein
MIFLMNGRQIQRAIDAHNGDANNAAELTATITARLVMLGPIADA